MKILNSEKAVSEVVGYMLIFTIVVLSIGLMYTYGYPILEDLQERIKFQNAEQGFDVLQADLNRIAFDQAPVRTTIINTGGGSVRASQDGDKISVVVSSDGLKKYEKTIDFGIIEYRRMGKTIAYVDGGVFTKQGDRAYLKYSPLIDAINDTESSYLTVFISIFSIQCSYPTMGGGDRVSVVSRYNRSSGSVFINQSSNSSLSNVTLTINSTYYADSWEFHFNSLKKQANDSRVEVTRLNLTHVRAFIPFNKLVIEENNANVEVFSK